MEDKELICEYCKLPIKETDHKCPNCGANCTKIISDYKKQHKKAEEEKTVIEAKRVYDDVNEKMKNDKKIIFFILFIPVIIIAAVIFIEVNEGVTRYRNNNPDKVIVNYKEKAKSNDMNIVLDNYEFYEYKSDEFPNSKELNTPEGYQKIAFHFEIENTGKNEITTTFGFDIKLTADDYEVKKAGLEQCSFCKTVSGKSSYESLERVDISSGSKLKGYLGFMVPTNRKKLKFVVGDNITINMDNPAYKKVD